MIIRTTLTALVICVLALASLVGCLGGEPTPTPEPTAAPTAVPPTAAPTNTPLPPTPTALPTFTLPPPTNTPIPATATVTPTNTVAPVTVVPTAVVTATATVTPTTSAVVYNAPVLVEPGPGTSLAAGRDDLNLKWAPVGPLAGDECYLVTLRITNQIDNEYAEQSFIAPNTCNDAGQTDPLSFVVARRAPAPDYAGLLAIASNQTQAGLYTVTWYVTVVKNNGADPNSPDPALITPVSPPSNPFEFELRAN